MYSISVTAVASYIPTWQINMRMCENKTYIIQKLYQRHLEPKIIRYYKGHHNKEHREMPLKGLISSEYRETAEPKLGKMQRNPVLLLRLWPLLWGRLISLERPLSPVVVCKGWLVISKEALDLFIYQITLTAHYTAGCEGLKMFFSRLHPEVFVIIKDLWMFSNGLRPFAVYRVSVVIVMAALLGNMDIAI